jgi:hypothetical protein
MSVKIWAMRGKALTGRTRLRWLQSYDAAKRACKETAAGEIEEMPEMSAEELKAFRASMPEDTRNFTQRLLGDPPPGRSALDRQRGN